MPTLDTLLSADSTWAPVLIFFARVADVSLGTVRIIAVTRGQRFMAASLGFFELLIWTFAISRVLVALDRFENIVAFAGGFSVGNLVGMWIESRLAMGVQTVNFISRGMANAVAERLRYAGLAVTTFVGSGRDGPVSLCMTVAPRRQIGSLIRMAREIDPAVVITVEDVRQTTIVPAGSYGAGKTRVATPLHLFLRPRRPSAPTDESSSPAGDR